MKNKIALLTATLLFCLFVTGAQAGIILQDNFDSYATGEITNNLANTFWSGHSGVAPFNIVADSTMSAPNAAQINQTLAQDVHASLTNQPYAIAGTNGLGAPVAAIYASFQINMGTAPSSAAYFAHFLNGTTTFHDRIFATVTNGGANGALLNESPNFRIGVANNGAAATNVITTDLSLNTVYTIVTRYVPSTGISTVWLNPTSETNSAPTIAATATDTVGLDNIQGFAMRQNTGEGILDLDNLKVGTAFADVVPGSVNPPTILSQPVDNTLPFEGSTVQFKMLAAGDTNITYKWYFNTNTALVESSSVIGTTSNVLTLTNITVAQSGMYSCTVSNAAGTNATRYAVLFVNTTPVPPIITNQPVAVTVNSGDTATFSVTNGGSQPLAYQWKYVPATNGLVTNIVAGATASTLTLANCSVAISSNLYFVTITNQFGATNSAKALLTVNPAPSISIAQFRAKVDGSFAPTNTTSLYTLTGTVTTWHDMTGLANTEFYMQDASGGIVVFWSGADGSTNLPPAGARVQVTGPMAAFSGLLEIEPVFTNTLHSVTILSTNNPLPKAQPLPFDPNVSLYPATAKNATMDKLEAMYLVVSNVNLNLTTPTFVSGANDTMTNNKHHVLQATNSVATINFTNEAGQQFVLFINAQSGLPGQAKYTGPVTIYGVLGYFTTAGYEFTPSRFEDVIAYTQVTNTVTNVKHYGDLLTNAYTENVLRAGETMTAYLNIADPEGGTVTLTPPNSGMPTGAFWDGVASGLTAKAVFHYTGTNADAGNNYTMNVGVSSTSGSSSTYSFTVYVPTADEQKVAISEFLANPTTNSAAANFNPLHRGSDTGTITTNDQYIELANQSPDDIDTSSGANGWEIDQGVTPVMSFDALPSAALIPSSSAVVIYGGGSSPSLPVNSYAATSGKLGLLTNGTATLVLRNGDGHIVDRVVYSATDLNANGSLTRFPDNINGPFVPQPYVSTNLNTAGLEYDGSAWNQPFKVPAGVNNVGIGVLNGQAILNFTANTGLASTLWGADSVGGPYKVLFGRKFPTTSGSFTNAASSAIKFYYISNQ